MTPYFLFLLLHATALFDFLHIDNARTAHDDLPTSKIGRIFAACFPNHQIEQMAALDALTHCLAIFQALDMMFALTHEPGEHGDIQIEGFAGVLVAA